MIVVRQRVATVLAALAIVLLGAGAASGRVHVLTRGKQVRFENRGVAADNGGIVVVGRDRVLRTLTTLVDHYLEDPDRMAPGPPAEDPLQRVADYVAGMTDRYCIATFRRIALPEESRL